MNSSTTSITTVSTHLIRSRPRTDDADDADEEQHMEYQRGRTDDIVLTGPEVGSTTGDVLLDKVISGEGLAVWSAVFKPCARTHWHWHERGQLFFIGSGKGMIATRDGQVRVVQAGDVVFTPAGEEHWHGAAPDCL